MPPVLAARGLTKHYGDLAALDGLDLDIPAGEVFGFLGPNGAGKTTTMRLLLGMIRPTAGTAAVFGLDPWTDTVAVHRRLAYVPGDVTVWPRLRGSEILDLLGRLHGAEDPARRAELCERFEFDPGRRGREYSRGNRQKIALIAALMVRTDLLILDEPTAGLDPLMEVTFRECVREATTRGTTVLLSSHILSEVEALCSRVGILRSGRLVEVATLDDLRHLGALRVEVWFGATPPDLSGVAGVDATRVVGNTVHLQLRGEPGPLLHALAGHEVLRFESVEPSLEELFLGYYGAEDARGDGGTADPA